jgi:hypothetical protein
MPALLLVSFGYTLCMALGAAGLSVWLRAGRIDSDWMVYPPSTPAQLQRAVLAQAADTLIPDPIAPHTMLFPRVRSFAVNATVNADLLRRLRSTALKDTVVIGVPLGYAPATLEFAGVPLAGLIVIAISEGLWRGRIVMVMQAAPSEVIRPFIASLKFGITHFGAVSIRVWGLRLVLCGLCIAGIVMPCMMVCSRLVPLLARLLNLPAVYPISTFVMGTGISFVCALLATFSIVFDVKLVQAIDTN